MPSSQPVGFVGVAAALDCSTSTAGELVRKAEAAVIREFVAAGERD